MIGNSTEVTAPLTTIMPTSSKRLLDHALQDWQMSLMLLEQQNKKREKVIKQIQEFDDHISFADDLAAADAAVNAAAATVAAYSTNIGAAEKSGFKSYEPLKQSRLAAKNHIQATHAGLPHVPSQEANIASITPASAPAPAPATPVTPSPSKRLYNHSLQDYQMDIMMWEQQNKKRLRLAKQVQESDGLTAFADDIATANATNQAAVASAEINNAALPQVPSQAAMIPPNFPVRSGAPATPVMPALFNPSYTDAHQEYKTNKTLWEQQNHKLRRLKEMAHTSDDRTVFANDIAAITAALHATATAAIAALNAASVALSADYKAAQKSDFKSYELPGGLVVNRVESDYQTQLMILELQGRKRVMMARMEQIDDTDALTRAIPIPIPIPPATSSSEGAGILQIEEVLKSRL